MTRFRFKDIEDLGKHMYQLANKEYKVVTAILLYEDADILIENLVGHENVKFQGSDLDNAINNECDEGVCVTLDTELILSVSPALKHDETENSKQCDHICPDVVFYSGDTNPNLIIQSNTSNTHEIILENYYEENECGDCCGDCSDCKYKKDFNTITDTLGLLDYVVNQLDDNGIENGLFS